MQHETLFGHSAPCEEPPRRRVVLGTHWSLSLGIPLVVALSVLNLLVSLAK